MLLVRGMIGPIKSGTSLNVAKVTTPCTVMTSKTPTLSRCFGMSRHRRFSSIARYLKGLLIAQKRRFGLPLGRPERSNSGLTRKSDRPELGPAINLRACTFSGEVQELVERYPRLDLALVTWRPFSQPLELPIID